MSKRTIEKNKKPGLLKKSKPGFLAILKIFKPHALRGEVSAEMLSDFSDTLKHGKAVFIGKEYKQYQINTLRKAGKNYLISFLNHNDRDSVEQLRNQFVYIKSEEMPSLGKDEYYHHDLLGIQVLDTAKQKIGSVSEIISTGANDVYVIIPDLAEKKEILIPAIKSVIKSIDIQERIMIVEIPEWN